MECSVIRKSGRLLSLSQERCETCTQVIFEWFQIQSPHSIRWHKDNPEACLSCSVDSDSLRYQKWDNGGGEKQVIAPNKTGFC